MLLLFLTAQEMLKGHVSGTFLIRTSESRFVGAYVVGGLNHESVIFTRGVF